MKKSLLSLLAACGLFAAAHTASAQTATPGVQTNQGNHRGRIKQGVASGELTRAEAARLRDRKADTRQDKQAAKADGTVTRDERQAVRKEQARTSKAIYRQKHDAQDRWRANR